MIYWKRTFFVFIVLVLVLAVLLYGFVSYKATRAERLLVLATNDFLIAEKKLDSAIQRNLLLLDQAFQSSTSELCLPDPTPVLRAVAQANKRLLQVRSIALDGYRYHGALPLSDMQQIKKYADVIKSADVLLGELQNIKIQYQQEANVCFPIFAPGKTL